jgi:hypothetical protein
MPTDLYWGKSFAHLLMAYSYIPHNLPPDSRSSPTYWPPLRKNVACSKAPLNLINNKHSGINQTLTHRKATRSNTVVTLFAIAFVLSRVLRVWDTI